jgi:hypothetical protein
MYRLVCVALISVLSGTPAFAAVCAELCGLKTASAQTSPHCSKHPAARAADTGDPVAPAHHAMPAASHHGAQHQGDEEPVTVSAGHAQECCGPLTTAVAVATKVSRTDGASNPVLAASGPYVPMSTARAELRVLPPGSSGLPAVSRAPLVLRI